jgi:four helix bundle protein
MRDEGGRMRERPTDLKTRTKAFALRIIRLYAALPDSGTTQVLGRQLLRSGTSVGAHYRESLRARSDAEVISKLEGGLQELEETQYWLELLAEAGIIDPKLLAPLLQEADELTAILVTCVKRIKGRRK